MLFRRICLSCLVVSGYLLSMAVVFMVSRSQLSYNPVAVGRSKTDVNPGDMGSYLDMDIKRQKGHRLKVVKIMKLMEDAGLSKTATKSTKVEDCPIPSTKELQNMTWPKIEKFYHSYIVAPQVTCNKVQRMGLIGDGGWEVCVDPLYKPDGKDCLVYSYGIRDDFSFDDDMARYGCEVHSFDPSMGVHQDYLRGRRVHFHITGVGGNDRQVIRSDRKGATKWELRTLASHRRQFQHLWGQRRLDVVKMDVEGYEHESLMTALDDGSLDDVRQLIFETHLNLNAFIPRKADYLRYLELMRKVYQRGFRIYTTHRNMNCIFRSQNDGESYISCHEVHTVKIKH